MNSFKSKDLVHYITSFYCVSKLFSGVVQKKLRHKYGFSMAITALKTCELGISEMANII